MNIYYGHVEGRVLQLEGLPDSISIVGEVKVKGLSKLLVTCSKCKDPELFRTGIFLTVKGRITKGSLPCGCSKTPKWEEWQWEVLIKKRLQDSPVDFVSFKDGYNGCYSKVITKCSLHNTLNDTTCTIDLVRGGSGCSGCGRLSVGDKNSKGTKYYLDLGIQTGSFLNGTVILDRERIKSKTWLHYTCPVCSNDEYVKLGICSGKFKTDSTHLYKGGKGCRCSIKYNWNEDQRLYQINKRILDEKLPYINPRFLTPYSGARSYFTYTCKEHGDHQVDCHSFLRTKVGCPSCASYGFDKGKPASIYVVSWRDEITDFVKVGITNNDVVRRINMQSSLTRFNPTEILSTCHDSGQYIKELETAVKREFPSNYVSKEDFPDGHTETFEYRYYQDIINFINNEMKNNNLTEII